MYLSLTSKAIMPNQLKITLRIGEIWEMPSVAGLCAQTGPHLWTRLLNKMTHAVF